MVRFLIISVTFNILIIFISCFLIYKKGGLKYIKNKIENKNQVNIFAKSRRSILDVMPKTQNSIVFIGNSITAFCDWSELFQNPQIINRGIAGDLIINVTNRIEPIIKLKPKKIFLMIGVNDILRGETTQEIENDYETLVREITNKCNAKIYLQSILPTSGKQKIINNKIVEINKKISAIALNYDATYINLYETFKVGNNNLNLLYSFDGLHLNGKGYLLWKKKLIKFIEN